jgi:hypothetical protein
MSQFVLSPPLFGFVVGTRAALGFGLGLLLSDRIPESRRRAIGLSLVTIGIATTIPALMAVFGSRRPGWVRNRFRDSSRGPSDSTLGIA